MCCVYVGIFLKIGMKQNSAMCFLSSAILDIVRVRLVTKLELRSPRYQLFEGCFDSRSFLQKNAFLDILAVFSLDFGQISFNLVENVFATRQLAVLAPSITI